MMWWQTLQSLFGALHTAGRAEGRSLSRILCFYILSGYTLAAFQAAFPWTHNIIVGLGITIVAINVYNLFRINRLIRLTAVGELLEVSRIIPNTTGITSNNLIDMYWNIAVQLLIFMTGFCLLIPHIPLHREWWLALAWPTMFIFVAILFGAWGRKFLRFISGGVALFVFLTVLCATFPQIDAQFHLGSLLEKVLPNETADQVNAIDKLREQQRANQIAIDLREVEIWVTANPNIPYPEDYERFMDSVRKNGIQKTLGEIRKEIIQGVFVKSSPPPVSKPGKWKLVGNFPIPLSGNTFNRSPGPNGERVSTGEVFVHSLEKDYEYRFTFSGGFDRLFGGWERIPWNGHHNSNVATIPKKPPYYPRLLQGALTVRIGNDDGLHPLTGNSFSKTIFTNSKIFAEVNIYRELGRYFKPAYAKRNGGNTVKNSTLSIKIERRPI